MMIISSLSSDFNIVVKPYDGAGDCEMFAATQMGHCSIITTSLSSWWAIAGNYVGQ